MRKSTIRSTPRVRLALIALTAAGASVGLGSCNKHVFEVVPRDCTTEIRSETPIDVDVPADILIVVDNSGSMCEEQANLVENFFDPDCPIDVNNVQAEYKNPDDELVRQLASECGFVQLLAAYDNDWRLGVITTDVGQCDDRYDIAETPGYGGCSGEVETGWGRRPQRGCLQPFDHSDRANSRVLQRGDQDVGEKFANILDNVQTFGSAYERGLDAMQIFLDPNSSRAPGCGSDLDTFLRDEAKLVVIFLTDEDDCSHVDGQFGLRDENEDESCDNTVESFKDQALYSPAFCYDRLGELAPTTRYSSFLKNYKDDENQVSVAVIAGALPNENGELVAGGCTVAGDGTPVGGCFESGGNSNQTGTNGLCSPDRDYQCCTADPGTRYIQFARELGPNRFLNDSICFESFRNTMLDIAKFIAAPNQVRLGKKPANSAAIIVEITRQGDSEPTQMLRIPDGEDTEGKSGWQYDGDLTITFYGDARPQPGDTINVNALANRDGEQAYCGSSPAESEEETTEE